MTAFGAAELNRLLNDVAEELGRAGERGEIYVVGGSAMALGGYSTARTTRDIDARIDAGHGAVVEAVRVVARRHGLPTSWLNEQATAYMPTTKDQGARIVFSHRNLIVAAAAPERLLAMKLVAGRAQDVEDATALADLCDLRAEEMTELVRSTFGDDALDERARLTIALVAGNLKN